MSELQAFKDAIKKALDSDGTEDQKATYERVSANPIMGRGPQRIGLSYPEMHMRQVTKMYWADQRPMMSKFVNFGSPDWSSITDWIVANLPKILSLLASILPFII